MRQLSLSLLLLLSCFLLSLSNAEVDMTRIVEELEQPDPLEALFSRNFDEDDSNPSENDNDVAIQNDEGKEDDDTGNYNTMSPWHVATKQYVEDMSTGVLKGKKKKKKKQSHKVSSVVKPQKQQKKRRHHHRTSRAEHNEKKAEEHAELEHNLGQIQKKRSQEMGEAQAELAKDEDSGRTPNPSGFMEEIKWRNDMAGQAQRDAANAETEDSHKLAKTSHWAAKQGRKEAKLALTAVRDERIAEKAFTAQFAKTPNDSGALLKKAVSLAIRSNNAQVFAHDASTQLQTAAAAAKKLKKSATEMADTADDILSSLATGSNKPKQPLTMQEKVQVALALIPKATTSTDVTLWKDFRAWQSIAAFRHEVKQYSDMDATKDAEHLHPELTNCKGRLEPDLSKVKRKLRVSQVFSSAFHAGAKDLVDVARRVCIPETLYGKLPSYEAHRAMSCFVSPTLEKDLEAQAMYNIIRTNSMLKSLQALLEKSVHSAEQKAKRENKRNKQKKTNLPMKNGIISMCEKVLDLQSCDLQNFLEAPCYFSAACANRGLQLVRNTLMEKMAMNRDLKAFLNKVLASACVAAMMETYDRYSREGYFSACVCKPIDPAASVTMLDIIPVTTPTLTKISQGGCPFPQ